LLRINPASQAGSDLRLAGPFPCPQRIFAGIVCEPAGDQTIFFLFYAIAATACSKFPGHDGQGKPDRMTAIFFERQGTSQGFLLHALSWGMDAG
jgi:hypothetical protein